MNLPRGLYFPEDRQVFPLRAVYPYKVCVRTGVTHAFPSGTAHPFIACMYKP